MVIPAQFLPVILQEADDGARRLRRSLRLGADHHDDFRQDLLLDLLARLKSFTPNRGAIGPFAGKVIAHRAARVAVRTRRERTTFVHLDPDAISALASFNPYPAVDLEIDGRRAAVVGGRHALRLAGADDRGVSRASGFRRRRDVHLTLLMSGLPVPA